MIIYLIFIIRENIRRKFIAIDFENFGKKFTKILLKFRKFSISSKNEFLKIFVSDFPFVIIILIRVEKINFTVGI